MNKQEEVSLQVLKRDGSTTQLFDDTKIREAIVSASRDAKGEIDEEHLDTLVSDITAIAWSRSDQDETVGVEAIQDIVEISLMRQGYFEVAKSYITYRAGQAAKRVGRLRSDPNAVADYTHPGKYTRHLTTEKRRELFVETSSRVETMHVNRFAQFPEFQKELVWAFDQVKQKRVLPSMRSMQFGGTAVEKNNNRIFNCSFSFIDRPRAFAEAIYLLLCGCGVGFSVQYEHVDKLPPLKYVDQKKVRHHTIADTIEGWADAIERLFDSYLKGYYVEFSYAKIRAEGTPLKTSGGKAPGHRPLKLAIERMRGILDAAQGRQLRPIECYDILCHGACAVLSGGIRRSAMICLFSLDDGEMLNAKTGDWYSKTPWRETSNNSVMLKRDEVKKKQFKRIFKMTKEWGEPGFYFCFDFEYGTNPCVEIGLNPVLKFDDDTIQLAEKWADRVLQPHAPNWFLHDNLKELYQERRDVLDYVKKNKGKSEVGWAFCNLCEQNAAMFKTVEDFMNAAKAATIIGTAQATYTRMPYLGWQSELIAEREALLGVGMTGMMDSPEISLDPMIQSTVAKECVRLNKQWAEYIGIRQAARVTCVKPSGTTSLELGSVGSGIHPHHARRYIRRISAKENENVFQYFRSINPHMCVRKKDDLWAIEFPVEAPDGAKVKSDLSAIEFLKIVKSTQENWVLPGTAVPESSVGLTHNVSNTVTVKNDEWDEVSDFIWEHKEMFTGVSLLSDFGDKAYSFAPFEAIVTETDEAKWNALLSQYKPVDYSKMVENEDGTDLMGELACAGGACP